MSSKGSIFSHLFSSLISRKNDLTVNCEFCTTRQPPTAVTQFRDDLTRTSAGCQICRLLLDGLEPMFDDIAGQYNSSICIIPPSYGESITDWKVEIYNEDPSKLREDIFIFTKNDSNNESHFFKSRQSSRILAPTPLIHKHSGNVEALDNVKAWVEKCNETHSSCARYSQDSLLPSRVVDVRSEVPKLFISENDHGKYITLSHCWGDAVPSNTEKNNFEQRCQGIEISTLPQSFQDAISLTRHLGISFLWIDSLCIIQDDRDDWLRESAKMCDIYSNSYLTIAASRAENSHAGFFHSRDMWYTGYPLPSLPNIMIRRKVHFEGPEENPLNTRAWTLQELILSGRVLSYTKRDIAWRCITETTCECGSSGFDYTGTDKGTRFNIGRVPVIDEDIPEPDYESRLPHYWRKLIEKYTSRSITQNLDRLPALSGIAEKFKCNRRGRYFAGVWEEDLPFALAWHVDFGKMPETYVAPSWSWASVVGEVEYFTTWVRSDEESPDKIEYRYQWCQVIGANTTAVLDDTGQVTAGYLDVGGQIVPACLEITIKPNLKESTDFELEYTLYMQSELSGPREEVEGTVCIDTPLKIYTGSVNSTNPQIAGKEVFCRTLTPFFDQATDYRLPASGNVHLLMIGPQIGAKRRMYALFLILVPSTRIEGAFERIGIVEGFLPGGRNVWKNIWEAEEEIDDEEYTSMSRRDRLSYLQDELSEEDFEWCKYLPSWRKIRIV